jgi:hypothetical protein
MSKVSEFSSRVNSFTQTTSANLLEIGMLYEDAKVQLSKSEFTQFLTETSYYTETPSVRKWIQIGKANLRLKPIVHLLPPVISTIYKLTTIPSSQLDLLIKDKILIPSVTTKEIDEYLNPLNQKAVPIKFVIDIDPNIDEFTLETIFEHINDNSINSFFEIKPNEEARRLLDLAQSNPSLNRKVA